MTKKLIIISSLLFTLTNAMSDKKESPAERLRKLQAKVAATSEKLESQRQDYNQKAQSALDRGDIKLAKKYAEKSLSIASSSNSTGNYIASKANPEDRARYLLQACQSEQSFDESKAKRKAYSEAQKINSEELIKAIIKKYKEFEESKRTISSIYASCKNKLAELDNNDKNAERISELTTDLKTLKQSLQELTENLDQFLETKKSLCPNKKAFDDLIADLVNLSLDKDLNKYL